jgi:hypothetical protein
MYVQGTCKGDGMCSKQQSPILSYRALYPAPESNRHGFPQVFETSASTNSASWALATTSSEAGCKCIQTLLNSQQIFLSVVNICDGV